MNYKIGKLNNGIRYSIIPIKGLERSLVSAHIEVGSMQDTKPGIAHFLEHLFFSSYKEKYPHYKDYFRGQTSMQWMNFSADLPTDDLEKALLQLQEMIFGLQFDEELIRKEKKIVLNELHRKYENISFKFYDQIVRTRFPNKSPYVRLFEKEIKSISSISKKEIKEFYLQKFTANNLLIFIGLPQRKEKTGEKLIKKVFDSLSTTESVREKISEPEFSRKKIAVKKFPTTQAYLSISFPYYKKYTFNEFIDSVALFDLLAGGKDSILMKKIRYEKGLTYNISTNMYPSKINPHYFSIESCMAPESLLSVFKAIIYLLHYFDAKEFKPLMRHKIKESAEELKRPKLVFYSIVLHLLLFGELQSLRMIKSLIKKVSPLILNNAARRLFKFDHMNVVLFGNVLPKTIQEVKKIVRKLR